METATFRPIPFHPLALPLDFEVYLAPWNRVTRANKGGGAIWIYVRNGIIMGKKRLLALTLTLFFKVVVKKVNIIHWNYVKVRYYNHYCNFYILIYWQNTTFVGLSPSLPVICKAFWVPLGSKWGCKKSPRKTKRGRAKGNEMGLGLRVFTVIWTHISRNTWRTRTEQMAV